MEICQRLSNHRVVEYAAKQAAPSSSCTVDTKGRDRSDYRQLFALRAWLAGKTAPDHGGASSRARWEFTAVRNQLRSYKKEITRHPQCARYDLLSDDDCSDHSFEREMEMRNVVQKLGEFLTSVEIELLAEYTIHGCSSMGVWRARGCPGSYRYFCRQLRDLRRECRLLIAQICPGLVP